MPSLRKRVSSYFRQLSFHNEPRDKRNINENTFVTKYLQGLITLKEGPSIVYGKNPTDLPNYELAPYETGSDTVIGCYSGPKGGLTTVKRIEKHLTLPDHDIDFIDTLDAPEEASKIDVEANDGKCVPPTDDNLPQIWKRKSEHLYGISGSLYDLNQVTKTKNGEPIADCFGAISRSNSAILAVADGVNWGEKACIAAKSAIHGCLHYLNKTIFNDTKPFDDLTVKNDESTGIPTTVTPTPSVSHITNTREVFVSLLRAFNCAHDLILENKGMLTTLTVAVILPLKEGDYVCCVCNVGDTLAYVYSQKWGLRELTKGSHDVNCNRDMRDALGALGPVDGINPELSNLTLSITKLEKGDIVMVASDGLTDNFDPNVCRFTVIKNDLKKQSSIKSNSGTSVPVKPPRRTQSTITTPSSSRSNDDVNKMTTTTTKQSQQQPQIVETRASSLRRQTIQKKLSTTSTTAKQHPQRSKTQVEISRNRKITQTTTPTIIQRNEDGIPFITPLQRYELQLLLIEDILKHGISGKELPITTAKNLCENLVNFVFSITSAKRHTLEDNDLYFDNRNGVLVEVSQQEKKLRRKRGLEKVQNLPGKLDHVTVVAWNVGNFNI